MQEQQMALIDLETGTAIVPPMMFEPQQVDVTAAKARAFGDVLRRGLRESKAMTNAEVDYAIVGYVKALVDSGSIPEDDRDRFYTMIFIAAAPW